MTALCDLTFLRLLVSGWCGCCGREVFDAEWCTDCRQHIAQGGDLSPWECTWLAQSGTDCPWQVYA